MIDIRATGNLVDIGRYCENEYRRILFDVSEVLTQYPDAAFTVLNQRAGDAAAYPVPASQVALDGTSLGWTLTAADLAYTGEGSCEVIAYSGTVVAKSTVYTVRVRETLDEGIEPPEPWADYLADLSAIADRAETAEGGAAESALKAEGYAVGRQDGEPVDQESPYYQGNAAYFAGQAGISAATASGSASAAAGSASAADRSAGLAAGSASRAESAAVLAEAAQTGAETAEEAAEEAQAAAEHARDEITGMTAEATTLDPGESATASYSDGVLTIGVPRGAAGQDGQPGADGYSPSAAVSKSGTTATITITDKTGTTTATVSDGANGQDGHTPEKGVDYWTAADQAAIVADVEAEIQPEISQLKSDIKPLTDAFLVPGKNLFDKDHMTIVHGYMGGPPNKVTESANSDMFVIPIEGGKTYTITRKNAESRFGVGTTSVLYTSGSFDLIDFVNHNYTGRSTKHLYITTSATAKYMYVWYYRSQSDSDYDATLEEMMVELGNTASQYEPFEMKVGVGAEDLVQDVVDDIQMGVDAKEMLTQGTVIPSTYNLLDFANAPKIQSYITGNASSGFQIVHGSSAMEMLISPVQAGKTYTVTRKNQTSRFTMGYGSALWTDEDTHNLLSGTTAATSGNSYNRMTLKAPDGAKYIYVFYYRSASDSSYNDTIAEMMMVEGTEVKQYVPYAEETEYLIDDVQKGREAYERIMALNRWESRKRIYGIEFNTENESPLCERIADAEGLADFNNEFPWCEMRRCTVSISNGKKTVIYEGDAGFAVDGTAGNVMVEVPAFYVCRERIGAMERWMISGTKYGGFELHPWFINADGTEVSHRYIGAYCASDEGNGIFSVSGSIPYSGYGQTVDFLSAKMRTAGYQRHNIFAMSAIQWLFIVEYATRDAGSVFNGSDYNVYTMSGSSYDWMLVQSISNNTLTLGIGNMLSGNSFLFYSVGMQVWIGTGYDDGYVRNITAISHDANNIYITVDGDPITLTEGLRCGGISQRSGKTDALTTPSGYAPGMDSHVACFRYRGIENIWGNIWEILDGIKIKDGVYYISHDFTEQDLTKWETMAYPAPMVNAPDHVAYNWIKSLGFDVDNRAMILPEVLFTDNGRSITLKTDSGETVATVTIRGEKYYGNPFASSDNTSITMFPSIGGGWDHHENCGLFTFRFMTTTGRLYGERLTC